MSVLRARVSLFPTQFKRGKGQVSGGAVSSAFGNLDRCFSVGRLANLVSDPFSSPDKYIKEETIFGGYLISQFGHFITETIGRLPSVPQQYQDLPIVFLSGGPKSNETKEWQIEFLRILGFSNDVTILKTPTTFEKLLIPKLRFHQNLENFGDRKGRKWIRSKFPQKPLAKNKKIYVSRSGLNPKLGRYWCEEQLEKVLTEQGYEIVHPQDLTIREQIDHYRTAEKIILAESSAIHLVNLVCGTGQDVAIIQRRPKLHPSLRRAVKYFSASKMININCLREFYRRNNGNSNDYSGISVLDFSELALQLQKYGFIREQTGKQTKNCELDADIIDRLGLKRVNLASRPRKTITKL